MKKLLNLTLVTILSTGLMVACGSDDSNEEGNNDEQTNENNNSVVNNEQEEVVNETNENNEANTPSSNETNGDYVDQKDLRLGDSGKMKSTLGEYEVTFSNAEILMEIDGSESSLDYYMLVDISVTNLGESEIEADDIRGNFEITDFKDASGFSDISGTIEGMESFNGTIGPSDTLDGQMVFSALDAEEYYIFVVEGLIASGAVSNNLMWTFDKSEAE